jgi:hypothetical protein
MNGQPFVRSVALAAVLVAVAVASVPAGAASTGVTVSPSRPVIGKTVTIGVRLSGPVRGVTARTPLYLRLTTPSGGVIRLRLTHRSGLRWKGLISFAVKGTWKLRVVTGKSPKALTSAAVRVRSA